MKNSNNFITLKGFAGSAPKITNFIDKKKLAKVNLCVHEIYKNGQGELKESNNWFTIVGWDKNADIMEELIQKGTLFSVEGKLVNNEYTDKDNVKRYGVEISVSTVLIH